MDLEESWRAVVRKACRKIKPFSVSINILCPNDTDIHINYLHTPVISLDTCILLRVFIFTESTKPKGFLRDVCEPNYLQLYLISMLKKYQLLFMSIQNVKA